MDKSREADIKLMIPSSKQRWPNTDLKWSKPSRQQFEDTLLSCLETILCSVHGFRQPKTNITPANILLALNMLAVESRTSTEAMERNSKKSSPNLIRLSTIYKCIKVTMPKNGVCNSTISVLGHIMDIIAEGLFAAAAEVAIKNKSTIFTVRDIQIACLSSPSVCVLLNGRNDAGWIPALTKKSTKPRKTKSA